MIPTSRSPVTRKPMPEPRRPYAKKSLGQNFLIDQNVVEKIIDVVGATKDNVVIEIGPGRGALTERLVEGSGKLVAIEVDPHLVRELRQRFARCSNFEICESDVLAVDFNKLLSNLKSEISNLKSTNLVANLPYYISTAILQRLAEQRNCFSTLVLMLQREVVERIVAEPGKSERGYLTVIAEAAFVVEKLFDVSPDAFQPKPKVWSSVVRLTPKPKDIVDKSAFRDLISAAFKHKRKTILNNLKTDYSKVLEALYDAGVAANRRAESLSLNEWKALFQIIDAK